ncbi:hypothetical protein J2Z40_002745 [Cytobacillus eiseniae]|uniref:Group-specific protein n=1 Tax=Cytobacillus eiseniae TaxID=762947 RepID=A0ABS4RGZ7_9BACI|nr:hypothetical protein [Cytobacillus eiseniae]
MVRKIWLSIIPIFLLFNLLIISAQSTKVELLDIEKNKVIKTSPTNPNIQSEAEKIINAIDNIVKKFNPIPAKGYMIKIPLEPSILVENKWLNALIDEAIIIIPEGEEPYLLLFDDENNPSFLTFKGEIVPLLNALNFSL